MENDILSTTPATGTGDSSAKGQPTKPDAEPESDIILKMEASDAVLWALIIFFVLVWIPKKVIGYLRRRRLLEALKSKSHSE
eukprot:CAMPEP_0118931144 /NCGR_PEP_ID=MMETSP1169-20130426/7585_1 /TAXON_ID=36882 /ORGANISM="Pyramimonas obovata, Strain CCMP722" /LENGTH=81 /DNA_ID=CAMNT_0006873609 /DNA_START=177 /DNA_END=422 /DNA_ORIENTATION=-